MVGITSVLVIILSMISNEIFAGHVESVPNIVGAVVSNGRICADIGSQMLNNNGSAVDAAIATLLCEGVVLTQSMGIGGGFVATVYHKATRRISTLIARETAPSAAYKDMFVGQNITGARAAAIPGEILGYWQLHLRYGRIQWKELFQPSIKLCREGHLVSKYMANALLLNEQRIRSEATMSEIFVKEDGSLYKEGDLLKRPILGNTFERIAENGAWEFYGDGQIGKDFVEDTQQMGGILTEKDLKNYKVKWNDTNYVKANIHDDYALYTTPLPTSGVILAFILNVMKGLYTANSDIYWHRLVETFKHAYGRRSHLGDYDNEQDMHSIKESFEKLISQEFANEIRKLIQDDKTFDDMSYYGAQFTNQKDGGTANMAVLAPNGDAITITSTINNYFGSKVRSRRTGIILNDQMDDFSTPDVVNSYGVPSSPSNFIKPGKRPVSSMCPSIILDKAGNVRMLVGAAGGTKITTSVALAIIKYLILNQTIDESVNDGRLHHQLVPMYVEAESGLSSSTRNYLIKVGHTVVESPDGSDFAALTAIGVRDGIPEPYYDRRRIGSTATIKLTKNVCSSMYDYKIHKFTEGWFNDFIQSQIK